MAILQAPEREREAEHGIQVPHAGPRARLSARKEGAILVVLLLLAATVRIPTLDQPLIEHHAFRQTQTAYTAVVFHEEGVDLLHPKLPVFGAPFEVPFEFPLFQAMAAAAMSWGLPADVAMRSTALFCFLLSALLLWGLVRHVGGRVAAMATLALYLFTPFALLWSRASLIEYLAVAGALGWLWAGLLWRDRRRPIYAALAVAGGLVVMLVKPTTGAFWILPLLAYRAAGEEAGWRSWLKARSDLVLAGVIVVPFLAAAAWTGHADAIKAANPATQWLTSARLAEWNYGTLQQRTTLASWSPIMFRISRYITGYPAWLLPLGALIGVRTRGARFWAAFVAVPIVTILTFWNLYVVHDYYLVAVSPVLAAVSGFLVARAWHALVPTRRRIMLPALLAACMAAMLVMQPGIWQRPYMRLTTAEFMPEVAELARLTSPGDLVAFDGYGWSPHVPYYSRRAGRMINAERREQLSAAQLAGAGYRVLVTARLDSDLGADMVRTGRWTGVLGSHVYITGDRRDDLRGAPVAATDERVAAGPNLLAEPVTVTCGAGGATLPGAGGATVLHVAAGTPGPAKLSVAGGYGDVPFREFLVVDGSAANAPLVVECRDATAVTILGVAALAR